MPFKKIIEQGLKAGASDIHLREEVIPRMRLDGELYTMETGGFIPTEESLKVFFFEMLTKDQIERFEKNHELDFSFTLPDLCRMRINLYVQQGKFCGAMRIIPGHIPTMEEIYLPKACYTFVNINKGLVLVTGPTGCGKSTTLAAMIDYINSNRRVHILTIEDPIEFVYTEKLATVSQREIYQDTKTFLAALRHSFRQDPDVVLMGEMRDLETMQTAITLAETGHLIFSTLHTGEATQTVTRIIDSFPPHQQAQVRMQLSISLEGIISQLLLPLKGRKGRVAAREVLICTRAIRNLIRENKITQISSAIQTGVEEGMITMNHSLGHLFEKGIISYETALGSSWDKKEFIAKYGAKARD